MEITHHLQALSTTACCHRNQACVTCHKSLTQGSSARVGVAGVFNQKQVCCSALCERILMSATRAFVQGFLISWILCSFSGKSATCLNLAEAAYCRNTQKGQTVNCAQNKERRRTIKEDSNKICASALTLLQQDKAVCPSQKSFHDSQTVQTGLTDINTTPLHFGCELFQQQDLNNQSGLFSEAENFAPLDKNTDVLLLNSMPVSHGCFGRESETVETESLARTSTSFSSCQPAAEGVTEGTSPKDTGMLVKESKGSQGADPSGEHKRKTATKSVKLKRQLSSRKGLSQHANRASSKRMISVGFRLNADHAESFNPTSNISSKRGQRQECMYCGKTFSSKLRLKQHIQTHQTRIEGTQQSITCEFCAQIFMNRYSLKAHIRRKHSGEAPVECDICGKVQPGTFALSAHKKACHDFNSLCHICGAEFSGRTSFDKHIAGHVGVKRYFCDICGAGFVHNSSLNNHKAVHLTTKAFQCDICSQMFKVRYLLNEHLLKSHQCGPSLDHRVRGLKKMGVDVNKDAISRHANHQCVICGEQLVTGRCPSHPDHNQEVFQCPSCGDATSSIVLFYQHVKWHRGASVSHKHQTSLRGDIPVGLHLSSTSGSDTSTSLIKCEVCSKAFKSFEYLSAHMHQHREARFTCDVCSKRFTYKCNLKTHMSTHLDTWQFECEACKKTFRDKYAFKKHQLKHTEPQFKCEICGKALTRRPYLMQHYQKMHPEHQRSMQNTCS